MKKEMVVDLKSATTESHKYRICYSEREVAMAKINGEYWVKADIFWQYKNSPEGTYGLDVDKVSKEITLFAMPLTLEEK